jgi:hypothetical protein
MGKAKELRRKLNERKEPRDPIEAIFETLIKADADERFHKNHAQLGYLLKDSPPRDYRLAADELSKAIEIRDRMRKKGYPLYELNRAICNIKLDRDYESRKKSSAEAARAILNDLRRASEHDRFKDPRSLTRDDIVSRWLEVNGINPASLD